MATPAERQRRSRAHRAGNHQLCDPTRCPDAGVTASVTPAVTAAVTPPGPAANAVPRPSELGTRGRRLWRQLHETGTPTPTETVLIEEACRTADRLDRLDAILRGDEDAWLRLRSLNDGGTEIQVIVNNVLAEARQQQVALKQLLAELRASRAAAAPTRPGGRRQAPAAPTATGRGGGIADLTARIAQRKNAAR